MKAGTDMESTGHAIRAFFEQKYGRSGRFRVDSDSMLIAQMKKFLTLFTLLLTFIALVSLGVGGIGITNMMLVSVSERFREIGLRKALGATPASIRVQFLLESVLTCGLGGLMGILFGVAGYEGILFGASKLIPKLQFTWIMDGSALVLSVSAILLVGVCSGLFPALKAEKLQVIEALRSE
jgi:putative ABC transport system permease protein